MPRPMSNKERMLSFDTSDEENSSQSQNGDTNRQSQFVVNVEDGLTFAAMDEVNRQHRILQELATANNDTDHDSNNSGDDSDQYGPEFPTTVLVTGFDNEFFEDEIQKQNLEALFLSFGSDAAFYYFRSFKRVRVSYNSAASALEARVKMHLYPFGDYVLRCYFAQVLKKRNENSDGFLHPPTPDKQFLISPPASPPVDWEPCPESHPILDYDLISALAKLGPGECHELHKPESESHPSIVVHIADDDEDEKKLGSGTKIIPTKRPDAAS